MIFAGFRVGLGNLPATLPYYRDLMERIEKGVEWIGGVERTGIFDWGCRYGLIF
jgi:hypothetical protein